MEESLSLSYSPPPGEKRSVFSTPVGGELWWRQLDMAPGSLQTLMPS